jgi:hypothetical protein
LARRIDQAFALGRAGGERLRGLEVDVDRRERVADAVVDLAGDADAFTDGGELFDLAHHSLQVGARALLGERDAHERHDGRGASHEPDDVALHDAERSAGSPGEQRDDRGRRRGAAHRDRERRHDVDQADGREEHEEPVGVREVEEDQTDEDVDQRQGARDGELPAIEASGRRDGAQTGERRADDQRADRSIAMRRRRFGRGRRRRERGRHHRG